MIRESNSVLRFFVIPKPTICNTLMKNGSAFQNVRQNNSYSCHCLISLAFSSLADQILFQVFFSIYGDFGFIKELKVRKLSPKSVQLVDSLTGVRMED